MHLGALRGPSHKSGCVCLGRDVGQATPGWQAQGLAPGGRRDLLVTSSVELFFFLAATGDVEEDGGLSDSVPTSKMIPVVCLWSSPPPSAPPTLTSLGVPVSLEVAPSAIFQEPQAKTVSCYLWPGVWGVCVSVCLISSGDPGLVRPHGQAEKAAGSLGAGLFCCCLFIEEQQRDPSEGHRGQDRWLLQL